MSNKIQKFTDLFAWTKNHELVLEVYNVTRKFLKEELFGLVSQVQRAVCSITGNIAEGYGRYGYRDKKKFYIIAKGSLTEVQNYLIIAKDLKYITIDDFTKLERISTEGLRLICGLINSTER